MTMTNQPRPENEQVTRAGFGVTMGARSFILRPKTIKQSKVWKAQFAEVLDGIGSTLNLEVTNLSAIVSEVSHLIGGSDDLLLDLMGAYSDEIAEARAEIEDTATAGEAWEALMEVIRVEFPFLRGLRQVAGAQADEK